MLKKEEAKIKEEALKNGREKVNKEEKEMREREEEGEEEACIIRRRKKERAFEEG